MNEPVDGFCFFCFTLVLEADGYIIRSLGGEVALFARTTDGLDRAVRKYAKAVESGSEIADVTYHEGARVKLIEIAGRDVPEYTIYCEDESYILSAAQTFASRIKQACGAKLAVSTDAPAVPYIELRYVRDEALGNVGHRRIVTADGVTIECSDKYKPQSASFAVLRFLERNLDWIGLFFGKEDLAAADLVSIDAGTRFEETPGFEWVHSCSGQGTKYESLTERLFRQYYGDAAADMRLFVDMQGRIEEYGSCYHCWGALMDEPAYYPAVDADAFAAKYDELFALIERTIPLADSALEEERIVMQSCALIYKGSLCAYPIAKAAGDAARMAELCERYDLIDERLARYGMDMTNGATLSKNWTTSFKRTLKEIFPA